MNKYSSDAKAANKEAKIVPLQTKLQKEQENKDNIHVMNPEAYKPQKKDPKNRDRPATLRDVDTPERGDQQRWGDVG
jgi:hypothetical protein